MNLDELRARVKSALGSEDPEKQELAAAVAADIAILAPRLAAGEQLDSEVAQIKAQVLGLTAEAKTRVSNAILTWWTETVNAAVRSLLVAG